MAFKILIAFFIKLDMANKFNKIWKNKNVIYVESMYNNNIILLPKTTIFISVYVLHHVINILTYQKKIHINLSHQMIM
jgi:hypothetical protein